MDFYDYSLIAIVTIVLVFILIQSIVFSNPSSPLRCSCRGFFHYSGSEERMICDKCEKKITIDQAIDLIHVDTY